MQLKEVEDEHFTQPQPGPPLEENDDDYYTDTGTGNVLICGYTRRVSVPSSPVSRVKVNAR